MNLRVEHAVNPLGIDTPVPHFSWRNPGGEAVAWQVVFSSNPEAGFGGADLWDSGRVEGDAPLWVPYGGKTLASGQRAFWRVRTWTAAGEISESETSRFETGLLKPGDWEGRFLSVPCSGGGGRGYQSASFPEGKPSELWVGVDLGRKESFDRIVLHPAWCPEVRVKAAGRGYGFPTRFRIEGSGSAGFEAAEPVYETPADIRPSDWWLEKNPASDFRATRLPENMPGPPPVEIRLPGPVSHRFVRLVSTAPYAGNGARCLALDEFQIFRGEANLALGKQAFAPNHTRSSIEAGSYDWHVDCVTDGIVHIPDVRRDRGKGNLLRRVFSLAKPVARARAYVASRGWHELFINGKKAGDAVLDSGWTQSDKRLLYSTWDVTGLLRPGDNAAVIAIGNGWSLAPAVILQLNVEHPDGSVSRLHTDGTWRLLPGPVRANHVFHGEIYDAAMEDAAVHEPFFDDSGFPHAMELEGYRPELSAQMQPPIRVAAEFPAVGLAEPEPGVWVFDMGTNIAGWARLRLPACERREIVLRFAENIFDDGTVWTDPAQTAARASGALKVSDGMINAANMRCARTTDRYLTRGGGGEAVWEPQFTYRGFRFVELRNYPGTPGPQTLAGRAVHTDLRSIGSFRCSDPVLNWAFEASRRTLLNNLHSVPTDCPQRDERQGWGCDARMACEAMLFNFDAASTYRKWLRDWRDCQRGDGAFPDTAPYSLGRMGGDIAWGSASVFIAWEVYLHTGDLRVLREHFPAMLAYLDFLERAYPGHYADDANYGDWLSLEATPSAIVENTSWYGAVSITRRAAALLGRKDACARLDAAAQKIAAAFDRHLFDPRTGLYGTDLKNASVKPRAHGWSPDFPTGEETGSQASQVLPLRFGLVSAERRDRVFAGLVENVRRRGGHLSTGVTSTQYLLEVLSDHGRPDLAYAVASTEEFPGWGFMRKHGATTLWEHWEHLTGNGMNSHDHPAFSGIAAWMMKHLAGIRPSAEAPGFQKVILAPCFPDGLDHVEARLEAPVGTLEIRWHRQGDRVEFTADLPAGCVGTFQPPRAPSGNWALEKGEGAGAADGIKGRFHASVRLMRP